LKSSATHRRFIRAKSIESRYVRALRRIAHQVDALIKAFDLSDEKHANQVIKLLNRYGGMLKPWAQATGMRMLREVEAHNGRTWRRYTKDMGLAMRQELANADIGQVVKDALAEQVRLITSLPLDAAQRVHDLTTEAVVSSQRAKEIAELILDTGHVTRSRAELIARTEIGRTEAEFTKARANYVGSDGYIWRTALDKSVRPLHQKLEGKYFKWTEPPITGDKGERSLPGAIYNCRCYAEVVLPRNLLKAA